MKDGYRVWCDICKQESLGIPPTLDNIQGVDICYRCKKEAVEETIRVWKAHRE